MTIAIIQARMGSTRLPGKVLKEVNGKPLLAYQLERVQKAKFLDKIVVATSVLDQDDVIVNFCNKNNVECFRGSEDDVLLRYYECAKHYKADVVVRLTADCPLSHPNLIDDLISLFKENQVDYAAVTVPEKTCKFPEGSDAEIFTMIALEKTHLECTDLYDREHVTLDFWRDGSEFKMVQLSQEEDWSKYRYTVDYPEDFEVISFLIKQLKKENKFGTVNEVIDLLNNNPELRDLNAKYCRN